MSRFSDINKENLANYKECTAVPAPGDRGDHVSDVERKKCLCWPAQPTAMAVGTSTPGWLRYLVAADIGTCHDGVSTAETSVSFQHLLTHPQSLRQMICYRAVLHRIRKAHLCT